MADGKNALQAIGGWQFGFVSFTGWRGNGREKNTSKIDRLRWTRTLRESPTLASET